MGLKSSYRAFGELTALSKEITERKKNLESNAQAKEVAEAIKNVETQLNAIQSGTPALRDRADQSRSQNAWRSWSKAVTRLRPAPCNR